MKNKNIEWSIIVIPLLFIILFSGLVIGVPGTSDIINSIRDFLTYDIGIWYLVFGLGFVVALAWLGLSKYGNIQLGKMHKPKYSTFAWSTMIFTSTMAADVLFYSLHEWMYYYKSINPMVNQEMNATQSQLWASTYPLFHWGITPWVIYILPAIAYAYMFFVKNNKKQKLSEACRPVLGNKFINGVGGKVIDQISVIGLLLGTSTTFSVATPLITEIITHLLGIKSSTTITVIVLFVVFIIYTIFVIIGMKGISVLAKVCSILYGFLAGVVLIVGNPKFILESGFQGLGNLIQNFVGLSTATDPTNVTGGFVQGYTMYYIAYWIAWAIATPLFIGKISEGRTIKNVAFGGLLSGLVGTFASFIVFGNAGLHQEVINKIAVTDNVYNGIITPAQAIISVVESLPGSTFIMIMVVVVMIGLYSTTFDSITNVIASYSYKEIGIDEEPGKISKIYWSLLFIILPASLIGSEYVASQLQAMSIIAAMPISLILLIIVIGLFKQLKEDHK